MEKSNIRPCMNYMDFKAFTSVCAAATTTTTTTTTTTKTLYFSIKIYIFSIFHARSFFKRPNIRLLILHYILLKYYFFIDQERGGGRNEK